MKSKKSIYVILLLVIVLMLIPNDSIGQLGPGFGDNVDDENQQAPISGLIAVGLMVGAYLGIRQTRK